MGGWARFFAAAVEAFRFFAEVTVALTGSGWDAAPLVWALVVRELILQLVSVEVVRAEGSG